MYILAEVHPFFAFLKTFMKQTNDNCSTTCSQYDLCYLVHILTSVIVVMKKNAKFLSTILLIGQRIKNIFQFKFLNCYKK